MLLCGSSKFDDFRIYSNVLSRFRLYTVQYSLSRVVNRSVSGCSLQEAIRQRYLKECYGRLTEAVVVIERKKKIKEYEMIRQISEMPFIKRIGTCRVVKKRACSTELVISNQSF